MPTAEPGATRIQLCGRLKVDFEGRHVTPALRGRQGRVLLAYLVLNRGRSVSRDELIEAIWPETPPADPAAALRTQLSRLRSALGSEAVAGRDTVELYLPENTWIDIEAAERAIRVADSALKASDWRDAWAHAHIALNIAGRPFLAGFEAPWVQDVRRELEELELRARELIARAGIGLGGSELAGAERSARALIRAAPFRESGYLNLMQTLVASGNTAEALRTYDNLRKLLAKELGSAPGAEIQALHHKLLGGAVGSKVNSPQSTPSASQVDQQVAVPLPTWLRPRRGVPFVGRADELKRLTGLWEEARIGTRHVALVAGEPGVGKTRLVTEFAQRAHEGGATVLYGRADEEAALTYQPFIEALRHWAYSLPTAELSRELGANAPAIAALVPEVAERLSIAPTSIGAGMLRDRLFEAVATTLTTIASPRPLLLVIDDMHWADPGSLLLLRHIARSAGDSALMVLATYRPTEAGPVLTETLADLGRERLFERLLLEGLNGPEVTEMVASIRGGGPEPDLADAIREDTGGNPFLVEALAGNMGTHEQEPVVNGHRREQIYAQGIPELIREAVAHRIAGLGPSAAQVLEVASTIGREFESGLLVEVGNLPADEALVALDAAASAGLLTEVPDTLDRYDFSHALFRQAIYAQIPNRRQAALHGRLADVLERHHGSDPRHVAQLARHFAEAGPAAAPKALEYSVRAGAGALGALSFEEAVAHYGRALAALDASGETDEGLRCEILLALGEAEWRMGDLSASRETLRRAFRLATRSGDHEALGRAALGFCGFGWERGRTGDNEAINLLRSALAKDGQPDALRARLLARLAVILHADSRTEEAERLSLEALDTARGAGDDEATAAALIGRWHATSGPEGLDIRTDLTRKLASLAKNLRNHDLELQALTLRVIVSLELGDFSELDAAIAEHAQLADRMKEPIPQVRSHAFQAMGALLEGRFEDAESMIGRMLELGALAQAPGAIELSVVELFALQMEQGDLTDLEEPVRNFAEATDAAPAWRVALAYLLSTLDRAKEAQALLDELAEDEFAAIPSDTTELSSLVFLSLTAVQLGDSDRMTELIEMLTPWRGRPVSISGGAVYGGVTSHYMGMLAIELGLLDEAVEYLEEATSLDERAGALPWLARSRFELTRALTSRAQDGDVNRAEQLLSQAAKTVEQLEMTALRERMSDDLGRRNRAPR